MYAALPPFLSLPFHTLRDFTQGPVNMYNCLVVTVSGSTFENNHAKSVFTDLPSRVSGGGLSITINDTRNSSVTQGTYNYTIQNCTFSNNSANSKTPSVRPIPILQGGHINGRGGGVASYVVNPLVVDFRVISSNFTNNFEYLKKEVLTVSVVFRGNTFVQNRAIPDFGGAMLIGPSELVCQ